MFYHYNQNNSGGHFILNEETGITNHVIVEADTPAKADERAEEIGVYFDGCEDGQDCPCCGDRWCTASDWNSDETPKVYNTPVEEFNVTKQEMMWIKTPGREIAVHYLDGRIEWFPKVNPTPEEQNHIVASWNDMVSKKE